MQVEMTDEKRELKKQLKEKEGRLQETAALADELRAKVLIHSYTHMHAHIHSYTHMHARACTHARTRARAHTPMHYVRRCKSWRSA